MHLIYQIGVQMAYADRKALYQMIAAKRQTTVLAYVNNIALPNAPMCMVSVRYIDKILSSLPQLKDKLDFILITNGGDTNAPLRILSLLRSRFKEINVILPYRCYSAGTALALGCDNIIMLRTANLGPIDPSINNAHNIDSQGRLLPAISVEEVKAYFDFIKHDLKIKKEVSLSKSLDKLTDRISPLALGSVKQGISHAKLIARNLLQQTKKYTPSQIKKTIEMLSSDFHMHSYPICREEAMSRLGLEIIYAESLNDVDFDFDMSISEIYEDFAAELNWDEEWVPQRFLDERTTRAGFNSSQLPIDDDLVVTKIESHDDKQYRKSETLRIMIGKSAQGDQLKMNTVRVGWR